MEEPEARGAGQGLRLEGGEVSTSLATRSATHMVPERMFHLQRSVKGFGPPVRDRYAFAR